MEVTKVLSDVNKKIDCSDAGIAIKRGIIQAVAGGLVFLALRYELQLDEATAFAISTSVVTAVYKYLRRKLQK